MTSEETKDLVRRIREGELDINSHSLFFSLLTKGLILELDKCVKVRGKGVPHYVLHTGDDLQFLQSKGQDLSVEPFEVSNEDYVYSAVPRCVVEAGSIDLQFDQLTNPFVVGQCQYETRDGLWTLSAEVRRMPVKLSYDLKYEVGGYIDMMELIQQIICNMSIIRIFNIQYLGQSITCSYTLPSSFDEDHLMELSGSTNENKNKTLNLSLEVESNLPIYDNKTAMSGDRVISGWGGFIEAYKRGDISDGGPHHTVGKVGYEAQ